VGKLAKNTSLMQHNQQLN